MKNCENCTSFHSISLSCYVWRAPVIDIRDLKIGHYGRLGRLDRCNVTQNTHDLLYRRPSGTVCFCRVPRREDNGETDKSSCILIVTFLLKLSSQWVKIICFGLCLHWFTYRWNEKKESSRPHGDCLFSSFFYQVSSAMADENCRKERKGPVQMLIFSCTELNTYFGRPKWFEVDSRVEPKM